MSGVLPNHKGDTLVRWRHSDWAESSALTLYRHCEHLTFQPHGAVMVCFPRPERRTARPRALLTELRPRPTRGLTPPHRAAHWLVAAPTPGGHCEARVRPEGGGRGYRLTHMRRVYEEVHPLRSSVCSSGALRHTQCLILGVDDGNAHVRPIYYK